MDKFEYETGKKYWVDYGGKLIKVRCICGGHGEDSILKPCNWPSTSIFRAGVKSIRRPILIT